MGAVRGATARTPRTAFRARRGSCRRRRQPPPAAVIPIARAILVVQNVVVAEISDAQVARLGVHVRVLHSGDGLSDASLRTNPLPAELSKGCPALGVGLLIGPSCGTWHLDVFGSSLVVKPKPLKQPKEPKQPASFPLQVARPACQCLLALRERRLPTTPRQTRPACPQAPRALRAGLLGKPTCPGKR